MYLSFVNPIHIHSNAFPLINSHKLICAICAVYRCDGLIWFSVSTLFHYTAAVFVNFDVNSGYICSCIAWDRVLAMCRGKTHRSSLNGSALTCGVSTDLLNTAPSAPEITEHRIKPQTPPVRSMDIISNTLPIYTAPVSGHSGPRLSSHHWYSRHTHGYTHLRWKKEKATIRANNNVKISFVCCLDSFSFSSSPPLSCEVTLSERKKQLLLFHEGTQCVCFRHQHYWKKRKHETVTQKWSPLQSRNFINNPQFHCSQNSYILPSIFRLTVWKSRNHLIGVKFSSSAESCGSQMTCQ